MLRHVARAVAIVVLVSLFAIPGWIAVNRTDLESVADGDLEPALSVPGPGENGYAHLVVVGEILDWPSESSGEECSFCQEDEPDAALISELTARNADTRALLERALAASVFQLPSPADSMREDWSGLLAAQRLARLAGARARLIATNGDRAGAYDEALLGMRVAKRLSEAENVSLIAMMFATALQGISLNCLSALIADDPPDAETARALALRLDRLRWDAGAWDRTWASEYQFVKHMTLEAWEGKEPLEGGDEWLYRILPADYLWQPNRTLSGFADFYRGQQDAAQRPCVETSGESGGDEITASQKLRAVLSPNPTGNILQLIAAPNIRRFQSRRCHAESRIDLVQAQLAMGAYRSDRGRLPGRLEDLVPGYLPSVPTDRFLGAPLGYDPGRALVWSVGEDLTPGGGEVPPDLGHRNEPAVSVAF